MRIYPKKLRNIEDLEREKKSLLKESRSLDKEEFLSLDGLLNKKDKGGSGSNALLDLIPVSNPVVDILVKIVKNKMARKEKKQRAEAVYSPGPEEPKRKNPVKKVALEVIGGYLKWKAIELSYKGIKHLVNKRKEKRAAGL